MSFRLRVMRLYNNLNLRLQFAAVFLSAVGLTFGVLSYFHVAENFGEEVGGFFLHKVYIQIGVAIVLNALVAFAIQRTVSKPIQGLTDAMVKIADNHLDTHVPFTKQHSQIGSMARRVQVFKDNAIEKVALEQKQKDDEQRAEAEKKEMMNQIAFEFEESVGEVMKGLNASTAKLGTTAKTMGIIVENTNNKVETASSATQEASTNVNQVSSAVDHLTAAIESVNQHVNQSSDYVDSAVQKASLANQQVESLSQAMSEISEVTAIIQDIAEQTNLLALNATIEAARAGDAGKGFAVVASEVKNLASQTSQATERISSDVLRLQTETSQAADAISHVTDTIQKLNEAASAIAASIEQEREATHEISRSVAAASDRTNTVSENIIGVTEAAQETNKASSEVVSSVTDLEAQAHSLEQSVGAFLNRVREA